MEYILILIVGLFGGLLISLIFYIKLEKKHNFKQKKNSIETIPLKIMKYIDKLSIEQKTALQKYSSSLIKDEMKKNNLKIHELIKETEKLNKQIQLLDDKKSKAEEIDEEVETSEQEEIEGIFLDEDQDL